MDTLPLHGNRQRSAFRLSPEQKTLALILGALALRIVFAAAIGLGVDESYTVATARVLSLSTFDHPPAAWWLTHFAASLFGESPLALRAPFLLLFVLTSWLMFVLTRRLFGAQVGFYATLALNLSPVVGLTDASWILPDAPLLPAMLGCAYALSRVFFEPGARRAWWLAAGVCAGLAMLSKYHGVFVFAGAALFVIASPRQRFWLATPWPYAAGLIALLIFSPVVIWNAQNHWVSFLFQGGRSGAPHFSFVAPLALIGLQSLFLAPWIFIPLLALFVRSLWKGPAREKDFFLACLAAAPILLFTLVAFWSSKRVLPHWVAPGYLMLFPLLGREIAVRLEQGAPLLRRGLIAASAFMVVGVGLVSALPHLPLAALSGSRYPLFEMLDWDDFPRALAARDWDQPKTFIAATRWLDAGKLDYALHGAVPVLCLCAEPHAFGLIRDPQDFIGQDALIAAPKLTIDEARARFGGFFDSIEQVAPVDIKQGGQPAIVLQIFRATNFHHPAREFSLRDKDRANADGR
ncbi:MAG: glycosyltransferase family 39 protein [Rhodoblastus sp.]|uniref:glycosyltransferase family 39 protein n=1 Tax=Rhodoblastus sp. TaxID=1962975 RepID=UPI003F9A99CC